MVDASRGLDQPTLISPKAISPLKIVAPWAFFAYPDVTHNHLNLVATYPPIFRSSLPRQGDYASHAVTGWGVHGGPPMEANHTDPQSYFVS